MSLQAQAPGESSGPGADSLSPALNAPGPPTQAEATQPAEPLLNAMADGRVPLLTMKGYLLSVPTRSRTGRDHRITISCDYMIDSGASGCFVAQSLLTRCPEMLNELQPTGTQVRMADGSMQPSLGSLRLHAKIGSYVTTVTAEVVPLAGYTVVLGMPWLTAANPDIRWTERMLTVRDASGTHELTAQQATGSDTDTPSPGDDSPDERPDDHPLVELCSVTEALNAIEQGETVGIAMVRPLVDAMSQCEAEAERIKAEFPEVFVEDLPPGLPPERSVDHHIETLPGAAPPSRPTYRLSQVEMAEMQKQLTALLEAGRIRPSTSPYGAPVLFARKKNGGLRFCIDYRALNDLTVKNRCPLPRIDELLDMVAGKRYYSTLDLRSGYWQIRIAEADIPKTAFRTSFGHFEFKVMPFGLTNAPATFQTLMNEVLRPHLGKFVLVYLDDVIVFSDSLEEHREHLRTVLRLLKQHKLYAAPEKCKMFATEVDFLGHMVSSAGVTPLDTHVRAVREWPPPNNLKRLRAFLGLAGYLRKFVRNYAAIARPLTDLTRDATPWVWGEEQQTAFDTLKQAITTAPVLVPFDHGKPVIMETDACDHAVGAVLLQDTGDDAGPHPVAYLSKRLSGAEERYPVHERELLAVVWAAGQWRHYLHGSQCTVVTKSDHKPLEHFFSQPQLSGRQARWQAKLAEFPIKIQYKPGDAMDAADGLSRKFDPVDVLNSMSTVQPGDQFAERLLKAAAADAAYQTRLEQAERHELDGHRAINGLLVRTVKGHHQLCIPDDPELRRCLLEESHDLAGHFGADRTAELIARSFHWPKMAEDAQVYTRTCPACQRNKASNEVPLGLLQPLPIPERPWSSVSLDFITDLPRTEAGFDAILVVVDRLTKMAHFIPTVTTVDAPGTAELLMREVVRLHGLPQTLVSDRDPRFVSLFWETLFKLMGTKLALSTPYHPQTDGQTERMNRTLEEMLRAYVNSAQDDWDKKLGMAEFHYNNSLHTSTRETPFLLNYGQHPYSPESMLAVALAMGPRNALACTKMREMQTLLGTARKALEQAQGRQKRQADKRLQEHAFAPGDLVKINTRNLHIPAASLGARKLRSKYHGPLTVVEAVGSNAYRLEIPAGWKCHDVWNVSNLRPYRTDDGRFPGREEPRPPPIVVNKGDEPEYELEAILGHKAIGRPRRDGTRAQQYLVHWKGYPPHEHMWMPERDLDNAADLLRAYKRKHKLT